MNDDVFFAGITELNQRWRTREFSAVELTRAFCERLEKLGPRYNALALPMTAIALRRAKDIDKELKDGRLRGPLQAVPYGAKDLLACAGQPTTWGAKPYAGQVFEETAAVLHKLDKTGANLIGKLSMVELAGGGDYRIAGASLFGPGLNPWDRTKWSGGSSSGPGSAVAAGLVPYALGSETSGSILGPAALCGVTGLRPTYGLVSRRGAMTLAWTMDKIGVLARSADDCGNVLQAIAGGDDRDEGSAGKSFYYFPQYARPLNQLKIGFAPADIDWAEPPMRPALAAAIQAIGETGVKMTEVEIPDFPYGDLADIVIGAEGGAAFEDLIASGRVDQLADPSQAAGLRASLGIPAKDYLRAMRIRTLIKAKFREMFSDVDLLVAPARYGQAPPVAEPFDGPDPPRDKTPTSRGLRGLTPAGNLAGLPAISVPCGMTGTTSGRMPVGLQIVGPAFSENMVLALANEFQKRTDWHKQRPPVSS